MCMSKNDIYELRAFKTNIELKNVALLSNSINLPLKQQTQCKNQQSNLNYVPKNLNITEKTKITYIFQ